MVTYTKPSVGCGPVQNSEAGRRSASSMSTVSYGDPEDDKKDNETDEEEEEEKEHEQDEEEVEIPIKHNQLYRKLLPKSPRLGKPM